MSRPREEDEGPSSKRLKVEHSPELSVDEIAYLGPEGTYGQQAAEGFSRLLSQPTLLRPCPSIKAVYEYPSPFTVLPLENTIHGGVAETLDCLLSIFPVKSESTNGHDADPGSGQDPDAGPSRRRIIAELNLPIKHCLVVKKGVKMEEIRWVRSHEQALGQSSSFLSTHLPQATLHPWPSTAAAAQSIIHPDPEADAEGPGAAICSEAVLELHPELEVLWEGTQEHDWNFTRFILLSNRPDFILPSTPNPRIRTSDFYALVNPALLRELTTRHTGLIGSLHTRPKRSSPSQLKRDPGSTWKFFPSSAFVELRRNLGWEWKEIEGFGGNIVYLGSATNSPPEVKE